MPSGQTNGTKTNQIKSVWLILYIIDYCKQVWGLTGQI